MMWTKWLPWRFLIRRLASAHGFLDPLALLAQLRRFAQPSEVGEPVELLRAGMLFHARGLINSRVVQHNLDWVWPYWVERQFNPRDDSFIPRAFSITHVNLTHRNWTAVGIPQVDALPIVDPRGLLTPLHDGWSLDGWLLADDGRELLPPRAGHARQCLELEDTLAVRTECGQDGLRLVSRAWVSGEDGDPVCHLSLQAHCDADGWLALVLRPQNPEGVSFIHTIDLADDRGGWTVNDGQTLRFDTPPDRHRVSEYARGDVHIHLLDHDERTSATCEVGLASAAALFRVEAGSPREILARIPLPVESAGSSGKATWPQVLESHCRLKCPDTRLQFLYDAAVRTLVLHSVKDVYPGPYTYKRFWFRDAAFILHALIGLGFADRARRVLDLYPERQTKNGYFRSQEGEWDSNGEALWIMEQYCACHGCAPPEAWHDAIVRGGRWIGRKRVPGDTDAPHAGLLPAGFSAEHFGPNDFYYWDDFWGIAGLRAAARMADHFDAAAADEFRREAEDFEGSVERSLQRDARRLHRPAVPASPYRRFDAGMIGSLAMGYPLQLCEAGDPRLLDTANILLDTCMVNGAFFQDMTHSGLNAYLTLHMAQVLMRAGDHRYLELVDAVAELASPTGQWPEAIHPRTGGGCMGDGQHVWAAAEWVILLRNAFVREEGDRLIIGQGIPGRWLEVGETIRFGPAPGRFGTLEISLSPVAGDRLRVEWKADWHDAAPVIEVRVPGYRPEFPLAGAEAVELVSAS